MGTLYQALQDDTTRAAVAADAVAQAELAIAERPGMSGKAAQLGLTTINSLRPGFLERHVHALLPDMARAVEPHWEVGVASGDGRAHLESNADEVANDLLAVTDEYVGKASDPKAIAVYQKLRSRAPDRVAEQMPRIARFIESHS